MAPIRRLAWLALGVALALPAAFLLVSASMFWYGRAYEKAAAQVRNRLA